MFFFKLRHFVVCKSQCFQFLYLKLQQLNTGTTVSGFLP